MGSISVPDFDFTRLYYAQILERLIRWLRGNVPELSTENPADPAIQLLRAFALVGHQNNVLIDMVAHEAFLPTAQLRDSVVNLLTLIGFRVDGDIPAKCSVVLQLTKGFSSSQVIAQDNALFSTKRVGAAEAVIFEADEAIEVSRTDRLTAVYVYDASSESWTDRTVESYTTSSTWGVLPVAAANNDAVYFIHANVMSNQLTIEGVSTPMSGTTGVWEAYKDSVNDAAPDLVTVVGATLKFRLTAALEIPTSRAGRAVVVEYNPTGAKETCIISWDGTHNNIVTTGFLGQTSPSTDEDDYTVGSNWYDLPGADDETSGFAASGTLTWTLPKTPDLSWDKTEINGTEGYAIRYRVISGGGTSAVIDTVAWDDNELYVEVAVTQGRTRTDSALGVSDGTASQVFVLGSPNVIPGTVLVSVDGAEWSEVDSFLSSNSVDTHYTVSIDGDGNATITFGDGANGAIPVSSAAITATYRTDANENGNVGANTLVKAVGGLAYVRRVFNPRAATGWAARRGADSTDLLRLKLEGPASLRALSRAVHWSDAEHLSLRWKNVDGATPVARVKAVEGGYGDKTVTLYVVGPDAGPVSSDDRLALEEYFNGNDDTGVSGVVVANQRVYVRNADLITIDVTATVVGGNEESITTALAQKIGPLSVGPDGVTYAWAFGQDVTPGKVASIIYGTDDAVESVTLTLPSGTTVIPNNGLPVIGALSVTVS